MAIKERFPTIEDFMSSTPENLGIELVFHLQSLRPEEKFNSGNFLGPLLRSYGLRGITDEFAVVYGEGVEWAKRALLVMEDPQSRPGDWLILTRAGRTFTRERLDLIRLQQIMPEYLLHPVVRAAALDIFNTGHYQSAVFEGFKAFEVAAREAANLDPHSYGDSVIKDAFHYDSGILRDGSQSESERQALMNFARGAYGLFKNPRSHRNLDLTEPSEAAELLMIASHLLRIVDAAKQRQGSNIC